MGCEVCVTGNSGEHAAEEIFFWQPEVLHFSLFLARDSLDAYPQ